MFATIQTSRKYTFFTRFEVFESHSKLVKYSGRFFGTFGTYNPKLFEKKSTFFQLRGSDFLNLVICSCTVSDSNILEVMCCTMRALQPAG